jgi:hypothetical protein
MSTFSAMTRALRRVAKSPAKPEGDPVREIVKIPGGDHVENKPNKIHSIIEGILCSISDIHTRLICVSWKNSGFVAA